MSDSLCGVVEDDHITSVCGTTTRPPFGGLVRSQFATGPSDVRLLSASRLVIFEQFLSHGLDDGNAVQGEQDRPHDVSACFWPRRQAIEHHGDLLALPSARLAGIFQAAFVLLMGNNSLQDPVVVRVHAIIQPTKKGRF